MAAPVEPPVATPLERLAATLRAPEGAIVVGLISGTSADGVDAACCRLAGRGRSLRCEVLGAPGEHVVLSGCGPRAPRAERWTPAEGTAALEADFEPRTGAFRVRVPVGPLGIASVTLRWE